MAINLSFLKRLIAEDFPKDQQSLVSKIGSILNPALEAITAALNRGISLDDLNVMTKQLTVTVGADGSPTTECSFKSNLNAKCNVLLIGRVQPVTNQTLPTAAPFASYSENNGLITINNIVGLTPNVKWIITIIAAV